MPRDDFTAKTKEILGKRVGLFCSNPDCRRPTTGPHTNPEKSIIIGVAAHITAASPGGPRYDGSLSAKERAHISNGIWLCEICAALIDKDPLKYPLDDIYAWKDNAEAHQEELLKKNIVVMEIEKRPKVEVDLIWSSAERSPNGYSPTRNPRSPEGAIIVGRHPVIFWKIRWRFALVIYNNSDQNVYNVKITEASDKKLRSIEKLSKKNNIPALGNLELEAKHDQFEECTGIEADLIMRAKVPNILNGIVLKLEYQDEGRESYKTIVSIKDGEVFNEFG